MKKYLIVKLIIASLILFAGPVTAETKKDLKPKFLFQRGMHYEKSERNLVKAIEYYQLVTHSVTKKTTLYSKAWLRLGICYELIGEDELARDAYKKVIENKSLRTKTVSQVAEVKHKNILDKLARETNGTLGKIDQENLWKASERMDREWNFLGQYSFGRKYRNVSKSSLIEDDTEEGFELGVLHKSQPIYYFIGHYKTENRIVGRRKLGRISVLDSKVKVSEYPIGFKMIMGYPSRLRFFFGAGPSIGMAKMSGLLQTTNSQGKLEFSRESLSDTGIGFWGVCGASFRLVKGIYIGGQFGLSDINLELFDGQNLDGGGYRASIIIGYNWERTDSFR